MSSQPLLKQSPVSEGAEDRHKVSIAAPLGAHTCLTTSILDREEGLRADRRVKDNHSGLSGTGQANAKKKIYLTFIGMLPDKQNDIQGFSVTLKDKNQEQSLLALTNSVLQYQVSGLFL